MSSDSGIPPSAIEFIPSRLYFHVAPGGVLPASSHHTAGVQPVFITCDDTLVFSSFFADYGPFDLGKTGEFLKFPLNRFFYLNMSRIVELFSYSVILFILLLGFFFFLLLLFFHFLDFAIFSSTTRKRLDISHSLLTFLTNVRFSLLTNTLSLNSLILSTTRGTHERQIECPLYFLLL